MIAYGQEPDETGDCEADTRADLCRQTYLSESPIRDAPYHTGHRIDLFMEYDRFVVQQHITDNAACRTCDASHDDSHPEWLIEGQALLYASYSEQR